MIRERPDKVTMTAFPFRKAHFIGLAGVGMSATATLLRDSGVAVTGSDEAIYPPISQVLAREEFVCRAPYAARNIPEDADLIVIGKNARLLPSENVEAAEAFTRAAKPGGPKILSFAEVLALLSRGHENIVVAGSFGKTTSVSMMAHSLASAGLDPSWMIGAVPLSPARASNAGTGRLFLLEGDEYPSSNTDNRSKFLHYRPAHVLLAPLAHDHVNVFPTIESYLAPFHQLFDLVPRDGLIVAATSGELSERFLAEAKRDVVTFGLTMGDWRAENIEYGAVSQFTLTERGREVARVKTTQLGAHNFENMVGIGAFVLTRGLASVEQYTTAMASFRGVMRRLDRKSDHTSVQMFEGFGSSYDKAKSAIAAMKSILRSDACLSCSSLTRFRGAIATSLNGMMTCLAAVIAFSYLSQRTKGPAPMSKQVLTRLWSECAPPAWMPCPYIPARKALPKLALSYARTMLYYF